MPSNIQIEFIIDLIRNLLLNMKFNELCSVLTASDVINFWRLLSCEHFPELKKFFQKYICRFGTTDRREQVITAKNEKQNEVAIN